MGIIHRLTAEDAHKIAAGEVIERPVHALKELIENSIDAGADRISIELLDGGKKRIAITDTGCGIARDDLHLAVARHATSKIRSIDDLRALATHGFRGEALASIAAIGKLTLISRQSGDAEGAQITAHAGEISSIIPHAAPVGTTITVDDIFSQIPVRKAFLKSAESELRLITQALTPYALLHPAISFSVHSGNALLLNYPSVENSAERYAQIMGSTIARAGIALSKTIGDTILEGYCIQPVHTRRDRSSLIVAVNNRPVKSSRLTTAIVRGYSGLLEQGSFPIAFLHLKVPPHTIDVNVHPRKEDILFLDARQIEEMIARTIRSVVAHQHHAAALPPVEAQSPYQHHVIYSHTELGPESPQIFDAPARLPDRPNNYSQGYQDKPIIEQKTIIQDTPDYRIIGNYAATYIMLEGRDGLILIDQHAAHERVLYEKCMHGRDTIAPTVLLFPEQLSLSLHEISLVWRHQELFEKIGITLDLMGPETLIARTTPGMYTGRVQDLIVEFLDTLTHERGSASEITSRIHHRVCALMACKAAIKAGDQLSEREMRTLIEALYATNNSETCPHGRPTHWAIPLITIERAFKRR
jgi:DNA mismatch repair protein MutL